MRFLRMARYSATPEDKVNQINSIRNVDGFIAVGVGCGFKPRSRAASEDISNQEDGIADINASVEVGVTGQVGQGRAE